MSTLVDIFSSRVKAELLRLLFGSPPQELHVREIARRAKLNESTVRQELKRLGRLGLVETRRDGNRTYYRASPKSPLYVDLRGLVLKTSGLADVLRKAVSHPDVRLAFVFGSVAAGTERPESDVDLMVIGDVSLRALSRQLRSTATVLGREINPHVLSVGELSRRKKARDHFVATVLASPKVFLIGNENELESLVG